MISFIKIGKLNISIINIAVFLFLLVALIFSVTMFCIGTEGHQRIFLFESMDKPGLFIETRTLVPYQDNQDLQADIEQYIRDLLLGPLTNRFRFVFSFGTKLESCFIRDGVLYVNVSSQALKPNETTSSIEQGVNVFKKNIVTNFPQINSVEFFINSVKAYENLFE